MKIKTFFLTICSVLLMSIFVAAQSPTFSGVTGLPDMQNAERIKVSKTKKDTLIQIEFISASVSEVNKIKKRNFDTIGPVDSLTAVAMLNFELGRAYTEISGAYYNYITAVNKYQRDSVYLKAYRSLTGIQYYESNFLTLPSKDKDIFAIASPTRENQSPSTAAIWRIVGQGQDHTFTITSEGVARRNTPVPNGQTRFAGKFGILSNGSVSLSNYFKNGELIKLNQLSVNPLVYQSSYGYTIIKTN